MVSSNTAVRTAANPVGALLRRWRDMRGKTQLDLSLDAGISQNHISFVESGRSAPSRQTLMELANALNIPLRERNEILLSAGFAPVFDQGGLDAPVMTSINGALRRMLRQHEPYPAIVMDRHWNVLLTNEATQRFFNCFIDMSTRQGRRNLLHLMFDPAGMRPFIANWPEAARSLIARVHREALGHIIDVNTRRLLDELSNYPGVEPEWRAPTPADAVPVIPLAFTKGGVTLSYFSMITTVGTPQTVAAEELRIECMYSADNSTEEAHARFVDDHSPRA